MVNTKTKKVEKKPIFTAILRSMGQNYTATGDSIAEAINNLKPGIARGNTVLTIDDGKTKRERIIGSRETVRFFNSAGMIRQILLKHISSAF